MTYYVHTTAMVDQATRYDFNGNTGLYLGGSGWREAEVLLWFDGDSRDEQVASIDRLIAALENLKVTVEEPAEDDLEAVPA